MMQTGRAYEPLPPNDLLPRTSHLIVMLVLVNSIGRLDANSASSRYISRPQQDRPTPSSVHHPSLTPTPRRHRRAQVENLARAATSKQISRNNAVARARPVRCKSCLVSNSPLLHRQTNPNSAMWF